MNAYIPPVCTHIYVQAPSEMQVSEDGDPQGVEERPSTVEDSAAEDSAGQMETEVVQSPLCPATWSCCGKVVHLCSDYSCISWILVLSICDV